MKKEWKGGGWRKDGEEWRRSEEGVEGSGGGGRMGRERRSVASEIVAFLNKLQMGESTAHLEKYS